MPSSDILLAFLLATAVFAYMPGPAMLYATAQTVARGRRAGWLAALGIHLGGYIHVLTAALGLAVLFELVPVLYSVLKFAGAAYLVWLGAKMILSRGTKTHSAPTEAKSTRRAFWDSVTVELLNPKTALFFVAFLPQFSDPGAVWPIWAQLIVLGTVVNVMFSSADVVCVLLADRLTHTLRHAQGATRWAQRAGGTLLVALGLNVALSRS